MVTKAVLRINNNSIIKVQYNPSSLHFSCASGVFLQKKAGGIGGEQYKQITVKGNTELRVTLVFEGDKVQTQIKEILSLLDKRKVETVTFQWGTISFCGEVTGANAIYKMFHTLGYPIRGEIGLTIRQVEIGGL